MPRFSGISIAWDYKKNPENISVYRNDRIKKFNRNSFDGNTNWFFIKTFAGYTIYQIMRHSVDGGSTVAFWNFLTSLVIAEQVQRQIGPGQRIMFLKTLL